MGSHAFRHRTGKGLGHAFGFRPVASDTAPPGRINSVRAKPCLRFLFPPLVVGASNARAENWDSAPPAALREPRAQRNVAAIESESDRSITLFR
jgi:hypothetical protein